MIRVFDICSGIGGFSLALHATGGYKTVGFCEFDEYCQTILKKNFPDVPIFKDLKELAKDEDTIRSIPDHDLICGGVPCQSWSAAGKQKGTEDDRHLWPSMFDIIIKKKPTYVVVENVRGFITLGGADLVLHDLESARYASTTLVLPALSVKAPHRRDRVWIIGKKIQE